MDILLGRLTQHAVSYGMNMALRSGVTLATGFVMKECSQLLSKAPQSQEKQQISRLQPRLESKVRIISPAIDMIELIAARGHTSLESAVHLTKNIRQSIVELGRRLQQATEEQELADRGSKRAKSADDTTRSLKRIIEDMKDLIDKIDDAVPLVSLAIVTSGVNLSSKLSSTISPSRLLQASTFLTAADTAYTLGGGRTQVGPTFMVSLYMLFAGHASRAVDEAGVRETTWKEVLHKAHVKLLRSEEGSGRFAYQLSIVEDLDDDRIHTYEDHEAQPGSHDDIQSAGIRETLSVQQISRLFYADTGKILNIDADGEEMSPVLLLKRDSNAADTSYTAVSTVNDKLWRLPADLDQEWLALQVYTAADDSDDEADTSRSSLSGAFSALSFRQSTPVSTLSAQQPVQTSLSLLEMLIKLTGLQQFRQESHLSIEDELLNFFLMESATAGVDRQHRQAVRKLAVNRVGFDPYDASPVKQQYTRDSPPVWTSGMTTPNLSYPQSSATPSSS